MQSNKLSLYESIIQTVIGVVFGFLIQKFLFPLIGIIINDEQNIKAITIFLFASFIRQYGIRRIFNLFKK